MSKGSSGLFHGTAGEKASRSVLRARARQAVDQLISNTPGSKRKAMAVGAYDEATGKVVAAFSDNPPKRVAPELRKRAKTIGGIGSHGYTDRNVVGACAEFHAVNSLLLGEAKWENIHLTPAVRPRTGKTIPFCANCRALFHDLIK